MKKGKVANSDGIALPNKTTAKGLKDRRTRKLMTMHRALNPKSDVARIYLSRKEGGRGLISVEDTVKLAILGLERYLLTGEKGLLIAARRVDVAPPLQIVRCIV